MYGLLHKKIDEGWNLLDGFSSLKECGPRYSMCIDCFLVSPGKKLDAFCLIFIVFLLENAIHTLSSINWEMEVLCLPLHPDTLLMLSTVL